MAYSEGEGPWQAGDVRPWLPGCPLPPDQVVIPAMAEADLPPGARTLLREPWRELRPDDRADVDPHTDVSPRADRIVTIVCVPPNGGMASGAGSYSQNTQVTVIATSNVGYHFVNWTYINGLVASTLASYTFTLTADTNLHANFELGEIKPPAPGYYTHGLPNNIVNSLFSCIDGENQQSRIRTEWYEHKERT